jgi:hypothetical protein
MPMQLIMPKSLFIEGPIILNPKTYFMMRSIGWLAFAVHIVAIGMADLPTQLYTVLLIVVPTLLIIKKTGCDDSDWMKTFSSWQRSLFGPRNPGTGSGKPQSADDNGDASQLRLVRECWIGSRLKAEVYEWPASYEFHEVVDGNNKKTWVSGPPRHGQERSKKRQDLYAWLALTRDEEESMDKWDLFPHIRNDNLSWWEAYKIKKHALIGKSVPGLPQVVEEPLATRTDARGSQDWYLERYRRPNRMATFNFVPSNDGGRAGPIPPAATIHASPGPLASSAFPAISTHEQEQVVGVAQDQPDARADANASGAVDGGNTGAGLPRVDTQSNRHDATLIDPPSGLTQSPTVMNARNEQP